MIKERLKEIVETAIKAAIHDQKIGALEELTVPATIDRTKVPEHGDFACGIAMKLKAAKQPPIKTAECIAEYIRKDDTAGAGYITRIDVVAPGFINFHIDLGWLKESLREINESGENYGKADIGGGEKVNIEYVSANPTGELHIGHGRNAVYGSSLANLLKFAGFDVFQEFYVNDAGLQIKQLGDCAWVIYKNKCGSSLPYPDEGYPEVSLTEFVDQIVETHKDVFAMMSDTDGAIKLGDLVKEVILSDHKKTLEELKIHFDLWYSEQSLNKAGKIKDVLDSFSQRGASYEQDGAVWLKSKELGDERDRVLIKQSGITTYLANDAAYHLDKFDRGFKKLINIWGFDHHGQVPSLKTVVRALGKDSDQLEIILTQYVNLQRDGKMLKMSKRAGNVVTLREVLDEVGADAVRYYLAESNPSNPINFDLELAKQTSKENPAFYIQYAHARCCAIIRRALEPHIDKETGKEEQPHLNPQQWQEFQQHFKDNAEVYSSAFDRDQQSLGHQKALAMRLDSFPEEVREAVAARLPGRLARYAYDLANDLQRFYEVSRVITDDISVTEARIGLILAVKQVLANVLGIIGVSAPERM